MRQNILMENRGARLSLIPNHSWIPEIFWNTECFLAKFFVSVRHKFSTENRDTSSLLPLLSEKFFVTRIFVEHRRVPPWNDSVLWDKTILTENRGARPSLIPNFFWYQAFSETQKVSRPSFSALWDQKKFNRDSLFPPPLSCPQHFSVL